MSPRILFITLGVVSASVVCCACSWGWPANGSLVADTLDALQHHVRDNPAIGLSGSGAILTWHDKRRSSGVGVWCEHISSGGIVSTGRTDTGTKNTAVYWDEVQAVADLQCPAVTDFQGGIFSTWSASISGQQWICGSEISAGLGIAWAGPIVAIPNDLVYALRATACDASGYYVAWNSVAPTNVHRVHIARITTNGSVAMGWPTGGMQVEGAVDTDRELVDVVADGVGGVFVLWVEDGGVHATRLSGAGTPSPGWSLGGKVVVPPAVFDGPVAAVTDGLGGMYLCWADGQSAPGISEARGNLRIARVSASGGNVDGWGDSLGVVAANSGAVAELAAASAGDSGVVVAWTDVRSGGPASRNIFATRVRTDGSVPAQFGQAGVEVCGAVGSQLAPLVVCASNSPMTVVWQDARALPQISLYAAVVSMNGSLAAATSPDGVALDSADGVQSATAACSDGAGGAFVAWRDTRSGTLSGVALYSTRIFADGTLAVESPPRDLRPRLEVWDAGAAVLGYRIPGEGAVTGKLEVFGIGGRRIGMALVENRTGRLRLRGGSVGRTREVVFVRFLSPGQDAVTAKVVLGR